MFENVLNDTQEQVVDVPETEIETSEVTTEPQSEVEEVANPQQSEAKQTPEENSKFAEFRKAKEAAEKEALKAKEERDKIINNLNIYGFKGKTAEEIEAEINAHQQGIGVDEYISQKEQKQKEIDEIIKNDPRIIEAEKLKTEVSLQKDLQSIKEIYPDVKANSVLELGETFVKLMATGTVDAVTAYEVQLRENERTSKPVPPKIGAVNTEPAEKEFYTSEEVDRLTSEDYDKDPSLWDKVRRSMLKWK